MRLLRRRRVSGAAGLGRGPSAGSRGQAEHGAGRRAGLVGIPEPGHARPRSGRGGNGRPPGNAVVLFSGLRMRYVASYLLAALGGNTSPSAKDIKKILDSVGIEADDDRLNKVGAPGPGRRALCTWGPFFYPLRVLPRGGWCAGGLWLPMWLFIGLLFGGSDTATRKRKLGVRHSGSVET